MSNNMQRAATERLAQSVRGILESRRILNPHIDPLMQYPWAAAIRGVAENDFSSPGAAAARLISDELLSMQPVKLTTPRNLLTPRAALFAKRTQQEYLATLATAGAELVGVDTLYDQFVYGPTARPVTKRLGALEIFGLKANAIVPQATSATVPQVTTTAGSSPVAPTAFPESEIAFAGTPLEAEPCQLGVTQKASYLMLKQVPQLADRLLPTDGANALAAAEDALGLAGDGASGQPTGVTSTTGILTASGASCTQATLVAAVEGLASANTILNRRNLGWVTTPTVAALLAQRQCIAGSNFPRFLWEGSPETGTILGLPALATNTAPAGTLILGDWSRLAFFYWGSEDQVIELAVNPYSAFASGDVMFRLIETMNVAAVRPSAFYVLTGVT